MEMTHLGFGIWSYIWRRTGPILVETRPATIITSAWRGDGLNTSAPNRDTSKRDAAAAIISIAQQARPNVSGQRLLRRAQLTSSASDARTKGWPAGPKPGVAMLESCAEISIVDLAIAGS